MHGTGHVLGHSLSGPLSRVASLIELFPGRRHDLFDRSCTLFRIQVIKRTHDLFGKLAYSLGNLIEVGGAGEQEIEFGDSLLKPLPQVIHGPRGRIDVLGGSGSSLVHGAEIGGRPAVGSRPVRQLNVAGRFEPEPKCHIPDDS